MGVAVFFLMSVGIMKAQEKDALIACLEEVKQIREKEGKNWYTKNKTSCLGEEVIGEWSVLKLSDFDKKEIYNDMELEFFAFFDVPVAGVEVRKGQMEYQKTSKPASQPPGYKIEKKVEDPEIGDQSQHQIETTDLDIAFGYDNFSPVWVSNVIYQELMVIVGDCSFMVGGRAGRGDSWSFNHRVDWKNDAVVNSDHDHGEGVVKERMQEYARGLVQRISGVCGSLEGTSETKKGSLVDWAKGLLEKSKDKAPESEKSQEIVSGQTWESVKFMTEEERRGLGGVNRWIEDNFSGFEMKEIEKESSEYESYGRTPQMTDQIIKQAQGAWKKSTEGVAFFDEESFPKEWRVKLEDQIEPGAEIISGEDFTAIIKADGGSVLYYPTSFGVYVIENTYDLKGGVVEVKTGTAPIDIKTINAFIKSKGTHYWVFYDAAKRITEVGVYEGKVEVTTRDGKTITLVPDGDRPGVVVIKQKQSVFKLIFAAGALILTVLGIGYILRKKRMGKKRK